jgi:DNA-3-methyladenine glycosylase
VKSNSRGVGALNDMGAVSGRRLTTSFFERPCADVARDLIGCVFTRTLEDGTMLAARLVEVEAYVGDGTDPGSHAHRGPTARSRVMFGPAGRLYVYLIYGLHHCANIVCEGGRGAAVLLRAAEPIAGIDLMRRHRALDASAPDAAVLRGPANFCRALGLTRDDNGRSLLSGSFAVRAPSARSIRPAISVSTRIGLSRGVELPYRFFAANDPHVSGARPGARR